MGRTLYFAFSALVGAIVFLASWGYAVAAYGWFIGLAFGWIPAAIIALLAALLWPLALLGGLFLYALLHR